eukprot:CAMPEP_0171141852 /NCGR_PEP_ID=MMETSP0766_2-20121228/141344_1 /TAXON_ID=439317 /ORGANISM="Gambierdiscus australes, Strain CAWD 149" /LENGTH=490 /DNA_ID=CAMNT_0011605603 /DNA_START=68 /DNA_END=1541 /DNA_ORIENTATION=-
MLWKMVIRPPRDVYSMEELGPAKFRLGRRVYERRDLQLRSSRGVLECSHFLPAKSADAKRPCIVYLHGNCSSRLEAFDALPVLLPRDLTVFCLDLSGSGLSEGEYISLGHHEEKDLRVVLQHLRSLDCVTAIGLWGRSMGATTSILRAAEDHDLAACVLDSAFRDLRTVAEELVSRGKFPVPQFLVSWALEMIRTEVSARAAFDPLELTPIKSAPNAVCPAFFGVAADDTFVLPHHTQDLHNAWAGERVLRVFDGGHNGVRPTWFLEEAADFLVDRMKGRNTGKAVPAPGRKFASDHATEHNEDESSGDGDGKPTPRLVSPLTERLQLDADVAAVSLNTGFLDTQVPKHKHQMAMELMKMGFGVEAVLTATKYYDSAEAFCKVEACPTAASQEQDASPIAAPEASLTVAASTRQARTLPDVPAPEPPGPPSPPRRLKAPASANLAEQLLHLGFDESQTNEASKRCLTVEAAMDYFSTQRGQCTFEAPERA